MNADMMVETLVVCPDGYQLVRNGTASLGDFTSHNGKWDPVKGINGVQTNESGRWVAWANMEGTDYYVIRRKTDPVAQPTEASAVDCEDGIAGDVGSADGLPVAANCVGSKLYVVCPEGFELVRNGMSERGDCGSEHGVWSSVGCGGINTDDSGRCVGRWVGTDGYIIRPKSAGKPSGETSEIARLTRSLDVLNDALYRARSGGARLSHEVGSVAKAMQRIAANLLWELKSCRLEPGANREDVADGR